jgi:hypothetical protein
MQECKIIEPTVRIADNLCCRICGVKKPRKDFRRVWKLRHLKIKEMRVWCKPCQKLWAESKTSQQYPEREFVMILD